MPSGKGGTAAADPSTSKTRKKSREAQPPGDSSSWADTDGPAPSRKRPKRPCVTPQDLHPSNNHPYAWITRRATGQAAKEVLAPPPTANPTADKPDAPPPQKTITNPNSQPTANSTAKKAAAPPPKKSPTKTRLRLLHRGGIAIHVESMEDHAAVCGYFNILKRPYYTFRGPPGEHFQVVLRGIPQTVSTSDVEKDLRMTHKLPVVSSHRISTNGRPTPLIRVTLQQRSPTTRTDALAVTSCLGYIVSAEPPKSGGPPTCQRSGALGHSKDFCHVLPDQCRCTHCGEAHQYQACTSKYTSPPKCFRCNQQHRATFKG